jgi:hypothetical protein
MGYPSVVRLHRALMSAMTHQVAPRRRFSRWQDVQDKKVGNRYRDECVEVFIKKRSALHTSVY